MKKITLTCSLLLFAVLGRAQAVSSYVFSQSTEAYTPVSGTSSTATGDDGTQNAINIGFPFTFGGISYTTFSISTNGFIRLGNNIAANNWTNGFDNNSSEAPAIAAFWDDNNRTTGSIQYAVSGSAPNRILEVGWDQVNIGNNGNTSAFFASFKMRLYETTGQIDFIYGNTMASAGNLTGSIGINDLTSYLSVFPASGTAATSSITSNNAINSTADIVGRKFTFVPPPACSGVPVPGNTVSSVASICSGHDFLLSIPSLPTESGYSIQWQSSANGTNYTDIFGANQLEFSTSQTAATYYRALVTCGANSATSTPLQVGLNTTNCYCEPIYTTGKTDGDLISNVVVTGTALSNNTGTAPVNPSYTYFTGQPNYTATLQVGVNYEIQVTVGSFGLQNSAVWIDYNDDNVFAPEERVGYTSAEVGSFETAIYNILLDCTAPGGVHRMRVRDVYNIPGIQIDPCATYGWGETEDYDVNVIGATDCAAPFALGVSSLNAFNALLQWTSGCGQNSWDVHLTLAGGGLPTGTASNPNIGQNSLLVSGLTPATDYEFYVKGHCGVNGDSPWAGPFAFTTGPEPIGNDECETAFTLTPGGTFDENALTGTNVGATKSIGPPTPTCAVFGFGGDVWFSIVVPASGSVTVETQAAPGSPLIDTGMTVFSGSCGNLTSLGCSDDEGVDAFSMLSLTGLTPASTIYARVWEYANDTFGEFRVSAWDASLATESFDAIGFSYHPNPVKDVLYLNAEIAITDVKVYNLLGQEVMKTSSADFSRVDMTPLSKGAYLVKVNAGSHQKTIKIIKE
ncbi:MAG: T9SS type A sorting domain-containing protein [Flavobacterium sp.]|nr:MAG: T9SS type A sorting domain-containing protein [Flavobacterium sp.]